MHFQDTIPLLVLGAVSVTCFFLAYRHYKCKGLLLNNAYLYASTEERKRLNKEPYYRQTAIVFGGLGLAFLLLAGNSLLKLSLMTYISVGIMVIVCLYALVSTVQIMTKGK